jgi:hypothetical protein
MFFTEEQEKLFNDIKQGKKMFIIERGYYLDGYITRHDEHRGDSFYFIYKNILYEINDSEYSKEEFYIKSFDNQLEINRKILMAILIYSQDTIGTKFKDFDSSDLVGKEINNELVSNWFYKNF